MSRLHRSRLPLAVLFAVLALTGCRKKIDPGPGALALSCFSMNISAGDLLDPRTADGRLTKYLDELTAQGYRKQIRIILPPDWGPRIFEHWFPVIRARGFKILAILGQERRDSAANLPATIAWIKHILPLVRADLIGIQIVNEPSYWFTPAEYAAYHQQIAPLVRSLAPEVPIVAGDFGVLPASGNSLDLWKAAVTAGATDYDVLSIHVTGVVKEYKLTDFARRLRDFAGSRRIWITEGDWGQFQFLRDQGLNVEENFLYTWNDDQDPGLIRRPGGRLP